MPISFDQEVNRVADYRDEIIHIRAIYVAPASVLPEDLLPIAGCHHLTYLQPVQQLDGDSVLVHVAPLPHRLEMPGKYYTCVVSASAFDSALVYDRRLACIATCDLRELVEERAAQTAPVEPSQAPDSTVQTEEVPAAMVSDEEEADLAPLPTIFVSRETIRESLETLQVTGTRERRVQTVLLHATLQTLSTQMKHSYNKREYRHLQNQYDQVLAVQQRRDKGHGWQRVVTLEPAWEEGRAGWSLIVGVPVSLAA